ncbi:hypothetical protein ASPWEDRAFT_193106 [Aspergillus wentii DTO 134E9]|uniref:Uncharacterized protein n=1 Tax=Aspergillus wentii DTO 134E9 TaxID=1073089 RepID=A0A1L9RZC4_ASPWE|nr:uncharacterized protein ASPWEDRAFT_193106 [Aspergillus wentii DTO 134E9]OJJ40197.1 hypothetical protein ASPWEDRAFT_193106 [Aspergillus wentii DTO 134E9]
MGSFCIVNCVCFQALFLEGVYCERGLNIMGIRSRYHCSSHSPRIYLTSCLASIDLVPVSHCYWPLTQWDSLIGWRRSSFPSYKKQKSHATFRGSQTSLTPASLNQRR